MPIKYLAYAFVILLTSASTTMAEAQLSYNPWTDPNDQETIAKYYERAARKDADNVEYYEPEAQTELDRTSAYIELPPPDYEEEDSGFLSKVGNMFKTEEEKEPVLLPNTEENRQAIYNMQDQTAESDENSLLDSGSKMLNNLSFNNMKNSIKRKIPHISTDGIIHKFEKASGVNFKSIARKIKR